MAQQELVTFPGSYSRESTCNSNKRMCALIPWLLNFYCFDLLCFLAPVLSPHLNGPLDITLQEVTQRRAPFVRQRVVEGGAQAGFPVKASFR